jgi:hypothetical protein
LLVAVAPIFSLLPPLVVVVLIVPEYVAEDSEKFAPPHHANGLDPLPVDTGNTSESPYVVGAVTLSALIVVVNVVSVCAVPENAILPNWA